MSAWGRSLPTGLQAGDVVGLAGLGLRCEPSVEYFACDGRGREAQSHDETVGIVPLARAGSGAGIRAESRSHAGHLVGGDGRARPRPAEQHSGVGLTFGHDLADALTDLGPFDRLTARGTDEHDLVTALLEIGTYGIGHRRLLVGPQHNLHDESELTATRRGRDAGAR